MLPRYFLKYPNKIYILEKSKLILKLMPEKGNYTLSEIALDKAYLTSKLEIKVKI